MTLCLLKKPFKGTILSQINKASKMQFRNARIFDSWLQVVGPKFFMTSLLIGKAWQIFRGAMHL